MEAYQTIRTWLYRFHRKFQRKAKKHYPVISGLPDGLDYSRLAEICREQFDATVASVSHLHLSGWKSSGAYRVWITTTTGNDIYVIYKNAIYDREEIPALIDFPLMPGPPEYSILSQANGDLAKYLPRVYMAEEVAPGKHYRYLLEDLHQDYRIIKGDADKQQIIYQIPGLQRALAEWSQHSSPTGFLQYGVEFSAQLQTYARAKLEEFQQRADSTIIREVLREWPQIAEMHLEPSFFTQPVQLIHGDSNYTNFHISRQDPQKMKVVDWEWAGFASPYADLAALNKGSLPDFEARSFQVFCEARGECQPGDHPPAIRAEHWRRYQWCMLERGIMDAAFLSAQFLDAPNQAKFHLPDAIAVSLRRVRNSYRQLVDANDHTFQG